jgi:hypothetical protein
MRTWQRYALGYLALALTIALLGFPGLSPRALADDNVRIDVPANGASVIGRVEIRGRANTADPARFSFYRLHYGAGESPATLRPIGGPADKAVVDDVLGVWDATPLFPGPYTLQITVYDVDGNTTMASVVVNVLAAPTPTPRTNQPPAVIVPGATPEQQDDNGPTPTPIPELPELVPQIPQIDVPQQQPGPQVQPVQPQQSDPNFQPIQVNPPNIAPPPQYSPPDLPAGPGSGGIPTVDTGSGSFSAPPPDQINPVGPPAAPVVQPFQPAPPPPTFVPPTVEGLPL